RYVDQGCYAEQLVLKPGWPRNQLKWQSAGCTVDPLTGQTVYQRAGFYWVPTQSGRYEVQKVWQPNVVAQQVQKTCYVPQTVAEQVPHQVCKYVPEQVVKKVPYQVCRMVTEQHVRKVPVRTCRMVSEERVEQVPYQVCRMVAQEQTISVPRVVEKRVPVTYTYYVNRVICYRVPLDACGQPITEAVVPPSGATLPPAGPTPAAQQPRDQADVPPALNGQGDSSKPYGAEKPADDEPAPLAPVPRDQKPAPPTSVYDSKRA
ncbi:MAG: hypothetical protein GX594_09640, partial [Pirellulaceae bacterium]|nr:hypothetical protein [Pirellulaceae bacterium]